MPEAEAAGQLSRVAFISRGCRVVLGQQGVVNVATLAGLASTASQFDQHQTLRASRTVLPRRASSLLDDIAGVAPDSGSSGVMPRYADLRIYITCDFDLGSAISLCFGVKAFWLEKRAFNDRNPNQRVHHAWDARVFVVPDRSLDEERRQFLALLDHLHAILNDRRVAANRPDLQIYMWDKLTYKHLCRVIGRHLDAVLAQRNLAYLAWLFPPEDLLPNADHQTSASPITIVQDVVRAVLAAPIPHYYNLFRVARHYHESGLPENIARFSVHPLFEDEFSDHIPSERAHEIWTKSTNPNSYWTRQIGFLQETVERRLRALETVVKRLETDLRPLLGKNAASFPINPPTREGGISVDGELWLAFQRLNAALEQLEAAQTRAMPPHEREARHRSARLECRLSDREEAAALQHFGLQVAAGLRVYRMRASSKEVKARVDDFNFALSPEADPTFLESSFFHAAERVGLNVRRFESHWRMHQATKVTVVGLDRGARLIALSCGVWRWETMLDELEQHGVVDLSRDVIMDPVHADLFTGRLATALRGLGNPPSAVATALVNRALGGSMWPRGPRQTEHRPAADFIWDAPATHQARVGRDVALARTLVQTQGIQLNPSQWLAFEQALSRRLHLIWGPPGTGKSRTLRAALLAGILEAVERARPLRLLLTASTWNAIDNVLYNLLDDLERMLPAAADVECYRLRSSSRRMELPDRYSAIDALLEARDPSDRILHMRERLLGAHGVTLVASTPEQVHNLMRVADEQHEPLFDAIAIDEASQMDVAHAILAFCAAAPGAAAMLAGDPKQLSPIHRAEPPVGLEHLVGSVYDFFAEHHRIGHTMLATNYRSNARIVDFTRMAGYEPSLMPYSPDLRLNLLGGPTPTRTAPAEWPTNLVWSEHWADFLDPGKAVCCFVYKEGSFSQWNPFEADAVASLTFLLNGRLANGLIGERDIDGSVLRASGTPYDVEGFWSHGIGIVTPHRAQQGLVVSRLADVFRPFGHRESLIRSAVDTVERFQGQQRDVMLATFALGDPDSIRDEDEFLYNLNRFNVMASRARAKLIVLVTQEVVDHLATEIETMHHSKLLKVFVESYCNQSRDIDLGFATSTGPRTFNGLLKWR